MDRILEWAGRHGCWPRDGEGADVARRLRPHQNTGWRPGEKGFVKQIGAVRGRGLLPTKRGATPKSDN